MPSLYLVQPRASGGGQIASADINQLVNTLTGNQNTPVNVKNTDPIAYTFQGQNSDAAGKALLIYGPDGTTVLARVQGNGVVASPDGTAAAPVVTTTHAQTLSNKTLGAGTVLSTVSGQGALTVPASRVFNNAAISIPNNVFTSLTFNTERYKTDAGMHSTVTNTSRLVATVAGKYRITGAAEFATNATGIRALQLLVNGVTGAGIAQLLADAGHFARVQVTSTWPMAANDYVELQALQDSGAALNVNANAGISPEFWMEYVSA